MIKALAVLIAVILFADSAVITVSFIRQSGKLKNITANASALDSEITAQKGELAALRGSLATLQVRVVDANARASELQTKVESAEANVNALMERLNNAVPVANGNLLPPAAVIADNLTIMPDVAAAGSNFTVIVHVVNTGSRPSSYQVLLLIREYSQHIYDDKGQDIVLQAGESRDVVFPLIIFDKGNYVLSVDNIYRDLKIT